MGALTRPERRSDTSQIHPKMPVTTATIAACSTKPSSRYAPRSEGTTRVTPA